MAFKKAVSTFSLTSDFQRMADTEDKINRRATKDAANARNKANQKALGAWHGSSRGKMNEIPMPARRTT